MRKKNYFRSGLIVAVALVMTLQGCKEDKTDEFVADANTFKDFRSWTLHASNNGPDPALGAAHAGNDNTVTRYIYFEDNVNPDNGSYPVGALIVKESKNPAMTVHELTAMAKRGNDFNPAGGDWEWFLLNTDGTIKLDNNGDELRGANLLNGMCFGCHTGASTDFVFSK
jgi:hypothetical protein